ncbi:MAG: MerR family transcriptional regulator [Oscillospiraceae bacterium]|nr:MerR family transcriptional regulator [Oscillospiraceae bacterium]
MNELTKINEITTRYDVTARTLHYYEKMGLIHSSRDESSGYRLYDETAITRLKQILILRKMNISIKDIGEIFSANNSNAVLSVLDSKVDDIDNEVALLHELKELVLEFIRQMRQADFHNDADVKMLFDKAIEIETSLINESPDIANLLNTSDVIDKHITSISVECTDTETAPSTLEKLEIVKRNPCRFIGKSVYARAGKSGHIFSETWGMGEWIFSTLDGLNEYATDDNHNAALMVWDKYDEKNELLGYTVGRFMKTNTPVPADMDYIDLPETYIAKGWVRGNNAKDVVENEVKQQGEYEPQSWIWSAEVDPTPYEDGLCGFYIACRKKD